MPRVNVKGFSLKTQIYGLVIFLGMLSFLGSLLVSVDQTKYYLNEQMGSHAQDTATSLGLSIAPYLSDADNIIVQTMVSAIFDSGYYAAMELIAPDDKTVLLSRDTPKTVESVPNWFINMFVLTPPTRESKISTGWRIAGTLKVTSHAGASYYQLWQHAIKASLAFAVILLISLVLAYFILNAVLRPLAQVEQQAIAVSKKQFTINPIQPVTRELNVVVNALNTMVDNVHRNFNSLASQAEKFTHEAYLDKLTGLGNRRAFDTQFTSHLNEIDQSITGTIALVELPSLQAVNNQLGYQEGDNYVLAAVNAINSAFANISQLKFYRINGGSFLVAVDQPLALCQQEIQQVLINFQQLDSELYSDGFAKLVSTPYNRSDPAKTLLVNLDTLLTQKAADLRTQLSDDLFIKNKGLSLGLQQWNTLINDLIKAGHIQFLYQPVTVLNDADTSNVSTPQINSHSAKVLYHELLAKFYFNDEIIPNNQLFAMAERLNLTEQLDIKLITAAAEFISNDMEQPLAINLSQQSLLSESFSAWLTNFMAQQTQYKKNIYFEINESALLKNIELASKHIHHFKSLDIGVCIERFGTSFTSFKYIKGLDLDYIKIDGSYIRDLEHNSDNKYFIQAVNQICHGLGIKVIACHIESEEILNIVRELECDACQGELIQAPRPFGKHQRVLAGVLD